MTKSNDTLSNLLHSNRSNISIFNLQQTSESFNLCHILCDCFLFKFILQLSFLTFISAILYILFIHSLLNQRCSKKKQIRSVFRSKFISSQNQYFQDHLNNHGEFFDEQMNCEIGEEDEGNEMYENITPFQSNVKHLLDEVSSTTLICRQSSFSSFIKNRTSILDRPYNCSFLLDALGSTFQYFLSKLLYSTFYSYKLRSKIDFIQTIDSALIALEWLFLTETELPFHHLHTEDKSENEKSSNKFSTTNSPIILLVIPDDLSPNSTSNYSHLFHSTLNCPNIEAVCMYKHRMSSDVPITHHNLVASKSSSLILEKGNCNDLRQAIEFIKFKYPNTLITAVAYSSGCNLLLSYLGEFGSSSYITASVCISPWFDPKNVLFKSESKLNIQQQQQQQDENQFNCKFDHPDEEYSTFKYQSSKNFLYKYIILKEKLFIIKCLLKLKGILMYNKLNKEEEKKKKKKEKLNGESRDGLFEKDDDEGDEGEESNFQKIDHLIDIILENFNTNSYIEAYEFLTNQSAMKVTIDDEITLKCSNDQGSESEQQQQQSARHVNYSNPSKERKSQLDNYWIRNNPLRDIDDINNPVLFISSLDDPLVPSSLIPVDIFKWFPNLLLIVTTSGTHESFLQFKGLTEPPINWADVIALEFIESSVKFVEETTLAELEQRSNNNTPTPLRQKALTQ